MTQELIESLERENLCFNLIFCYSFVSSHTLCICIARLLLNVIWVGSLCLWCQVMVIVAESETFAFVFPDNEELSMPSVRKVSVGSQSGASVLVPIKPLVLGEIPISVKAMSSVASDSVRTTVLVKVL